MKQSHNLSRQGSQSHSSVKFLPKKDTLSGLTQAFELPGAEVKLARCARNELPGYTSKKEALSGLTQAFEAPKNEVKLPSCAQNELPGYTETQVKPFTVTDTVGAEVNDCAKEKRKRSTGDVKKDQNPKTLSKSAVKWVYLQIWLYFYGFRLALVILFAITLTATIVGFWLGFDKTVVRLISSCHCLF